MINLKRIDLYGQLVFLVGFLLFIFFQSFGWLFGAYVMVGTWQLISAVLHFSYRSSLLLNHARHFYEIGLIILLGVTLLTMIIQKIVAYYLLMLVWITPLMAGWYCYITYTELRKWQARALIHLK